MGVKAKSTSERGAMFIKHNRYEVTDVFRGIIWDGRAIIGMDIDDGVWGDRAWGFVFLNFYIGWKYREE